MKKNKEWRDNQLTEFIVTQQCSIWHERNPHEEDEGEVIGFIEIDDDEPNLYEYVWEDTPWWLLDKYEYFWEPIAKERMENEKQM